MIATGPRIEDLDIRDVCRALQVPTKGNRFQVTWRNGDSWSGNLNPSIGAWTDYKTGDHGGIVALVQAAHGSDRQTARAWLEDNFGVATASNFTTEERREYAQRMDMARQLAAAIAKRRQAELDRVRLQEREALDEYHRLDRVAHEKQDIDILVDAMRKWQQVEDLTRLRDRLLDTNGPELLRLFAELDREGA